MLKIVNLLFTTINKQVGGRGSRPSQTLGVNKLKQLHTMRRWTNDKYNNY